MGSLLIHVIPAILISFLLQIILHEIGHLIGGVITGWKLLYIQIHTLVINKASKGLSIQLVDSNGYQCIMYPKSLFSGAKLYTMGGCIINLISSLIGTSILLTTSMSPIPWLYIWCFSIFGMGMLLMNGISRTNRICNDKACYNILQSSKNAGLCHNAQLLIAKELMDGFTYSQIGAELICLCPDIVKNDIEAYHAILEYYYYLDIGDYPRMEQSLSKIKHTDQISKQINDIIDMERIYCLLLNELVSHNERNCSKPCETSYYYVDMQDSIAELYKKGSVHSLRVKSTYEVYELYKKGNIRLASDRLNETINIINNSNYIYKGERKFCIRQIRLINNIFNSKLASF